MVSLGLLLYEGGHRTLKAAIPQPKNKSMDGAEFLNAESDGIIFG